MGRLVDIDTVCKTIKEGWDGVSGGYSAKNIIDFTIFDVEQIEGIEAIPVDWIKKKIQWLKEHNSAFYNPAYFLETILAEWKEEQNG